MASVLRFSFRADQPPGGAERELVISALWDLGTTGVSEVGDDVIAGFEDAGAAAAARDALAARPAVVGPSLAVAPAAAAGEWDDRPAGSLTIDGPDGPFTITIRTAGTFGHGAHPTTRLALRLLLPALGPDRRVLDVGTGSGVLAIAAATVGAASVAGIDNDGAAIVVAADNATTNGVEVGLLHGTIAEAAARWGPTFDLVVANVLLPAHRELAPQVLAVLDRPATVITAGYLAEQEPEVLGLYGVDRTAGATVDERVTEDGWTANAITLPRP